MMGLREEAVAGQFYPENKNDLRKNIEAFLGSVKKVSERPFGIIVPHAGYDYSGQTAAHGYKSISESKFDTFVIIGTNHSSSGTSLSLKDFRTPLGIAKNDEDFSKELVKLKIAVDEKEHSFEHSIEVQIPFLQALFKGFRIVPIAASFEDYEGCTELAKKVCSVAKKLGRRVCIIASGDFTHYGPDYNYAPFPPGRSKIYVIDKKAIDLITDLKGKEFFEYSKNTTICGRHSICVAIEICKRLGAKKAELLNYSNSGDGTKDYSTCVSYASLVIE